MTKKKRVVVAMSGGVDSSVAASLLTDSGYDVLGITLQTWPEETRSPSGKIRGCCGAGAALDAFSVTEKLEIPHFVLDFQEVFRKQVIQNFAEEYRAGRTPNPCVRCNQFIKFDLLLKKALALEADYLATGHYANIAYQEKYARYALSKGKDERKDQSYVLYPLTQEELAKTLFPLGEWTKEQVRAYAKERNLPTAEKPESYDICFVSDGNYADFLSRFDDESPESGNIVNEQGEMLGKHQGLVHYTVGQRRGLGISSRTPLYVLSLQPETNTLVVGEEEALFQTEFFVDEVNWVSIPPPQEPVRGGVKIRYRAKEVPSLLIPLSSGKVRVQCREAQKAITPGQSAVFYEENQVLGGGIIIEAL